MSLRETVVRVAKSIDLIDSKGALLRLDSLSIVDLAVALEEETGVAIPIANIREETFESIDSVTQMLDGLVKPD
jgi:acyl carrier protein